MKTYLKRLNAHPGKGVATMLTVMGGFAGASNESMTILHGALFGAILFGVVCWGIVLVTAMTQPLREEDQ